MADNRKICVGMFAGPHGVRGLVRLRSFTEDPESIADFDELSSEEGKSFAVKIKTVATDFFIVEVKGVKTREEADAIRGTKLYVPRTALPKTRKHEFYEADLVGLAAKDKQGESHGTVQAVHNYGGGPFLEIGKSKGKSFMLPFTDSCVPEVDTKAGQVIIDPPKDWL